MPETSGCTPVCRTATDRLRTLCQVCACPRSLRRWFAMLHVLLTAQVPLLVAIASFVFFRQLQKGAERTPFLLASSLFLLSFAGLGISIFPDVVPGRISIWEAASPHSSQLFLPVGVSVLIPLDSL